LAGREKSLCGLSEAGGGSSQAALQVCTRRTVASALDANAWTDDVQGAITVPVLLQFLELHQRLLEVVLHHGVQDSISWCWCSSGCFSTGLAYRALFTRQSAVLAPKNFGRHVRRTSAASSSGSFSMAGAGRRIDYSSMVFKAIETAHYAAKARRI
jgi:hypothetical protein